MDANMLKTIKVLTLGAAIAAMSATSLAQAQSVKDIRWKNPAKVEAILGTPLSKKGPVGTVRSYQLWDYGSYIVAFTNDKVSHVFAWPPKYKS